MRQRFDRAAATFDAAAALHEIARERLLERLVLLGAAPESILDLGAATGRASAALAERFTDARILAADLSLSMARAVRARCGRGGRVLSVQCDAVDLPCPDHSIDLVFSNLLLPWTLPDRVFGECARVLRPGGLAVFTTLGPDTLVELRRAWSTVDDQIHVHGFVDMHDLGDLALRAGLVEPIVDVDRLTIRYTSLAAVIADLRSTGAANSALGRRETLTGQGRWRAFEAAFGRIAGAQDPAVTVELVFLQAFGSGRVPAARPRSDGVIEIAPEDLARMARRGRR